MLMPSIVTLAIVIALVRGGSLKNFAQLRLRWTPLAIAAFVIQLLIFTPLRDTPIITAATTELYEFSLGLLVVWVAVNWQLPGMPLMALGLLSNFVAIVANGGYMPVSPESAAYAGKIGNYATEGAPVANNSLATDQNVRLWLLTDILALPKQVPLANVFSIGDVLLTCGACWLGYRTVRGTPAEHPQGEVVPQ